MKNYKQFFEEFISPFVSRNQPRAATNSGPDIGMTTGLINNTFPSSITPVSIVLPNKKKKKIKKKKD